MVTKHSEPKFPFSRLYHVRSWQHRPERGGGWEGGHRVKIVIFVPLPVAPPFPTHWTPCPMGKFNKNPPLIIIITGGWGQVYSVWANYILVFGRAELVQNKLAAIQCRQSNHFNFQLIPNQLRGIFNPSPIYGLIAFVFNLFCKKLRTIFNLHIILTV
jgi:hypothetical protein